MVTGLYKEKDRKQDEIYRIEEIIKSFFNNDKIIVFSNVQKKTINYCLYKEFLKKFNKIKG